MKGGIEQSLHRLLSSLTGTRHLALSRPSDLRLFWSPERELPVCSSCNSGHPTSPRNLSAPFPGLQASCRSLMGRRWQTLARWRSVRDAVQSVFRFVRIPLEGLLCRF